MKHNLPNLVGTSLVIGLLAVAATSAGSRQEDPLEALQDRVSRIIDQSKPSIVSVIRQRKVQSNNDGRPAQLPPSFGEDLMNPSLVPRDFGSGVILSEDGLILTNYHVVEQYDRLVVRTHEGRGFAADIWAADPRSDLAVIRAHTKGLEPIRMGNADKLRPGHFVVALGNPYATAKDGRASASFGIVSNLQRQPAPPVNPLEVTLHNHGTLIQSDIRLHYGMSGGALLDIRGEMVGLTTSLAAVQGFDHAAGYSVPLDAMTLRILEVLKSGREVEYGFLGVRTDDLAPSDRQVLGLKTNQGARVDEVIPGTPAYIAGLKPDDVVVAVEQTPIRTRAELILRVGMRFAGSRVELGIIRDRRQIRLPVILAKFPVYGEVYAAIKRESWRGIHLEYTSMLLKDRFNGSQQLGRAPDGGVLVLNVDPESPADIVGIAAGEIITSINGKAIKTPAELLEAVRRITGNAEVRTDQAVYQLTP